MATTWRSWKPEDDQRVVEMANDGAYLDEIVAALDRSPEAIGCRLTHLRKTLPAGTVPAQLCIRGRKCSTSPRNVKRVEKTERKCLGCGNPFPSAHSMNRLCGSCRNRTTSPYAP